MSTESIPPQESNSKRFREWGLWTLAAIAVWTASADAQVQMTEVTEAAGLEPTSFASTTDHSLGINWIDFDDDGWPDLFLVGGNPMRDCRLFHSQGDGTFADAGDLLPAIPAVETSGSVFADYDRDGDLDIYVYTDNQVWDPVPAANPDGGPANLLLENQWVENGGAAVAGQPLFAEVALYQTLGLVQLELRTRNLPWAKA